MKLRHRPGQRAKNKIGPYKGPRSRHGTASRYEYGCRCVTCRKANRERKRQYRELNPLVGREIAKRYRERHPDKAKASLRAYYRKNQARLLDGAMKKRHGLSRKEVVALGVKQGGCGICGAALPKRYDGKKMHVDHDHKTGRIRGILCVLCNQGLGKLGDDFYGVLRALAYLIESEDR